KSISCTPSGPLGVFRDKTLSNQIVLPAAIGGLAKLAESSLKAEPVRLISWFELAMPSLLSVKLSDDVRVPVSLGLNTTLTVQDDNAARLLPQVFDTIVKSPLFPPAI